MVCIPTNGYCDRYSRSVYCMLNNIVYVSANTFRPQDTCAVLVLSIPLMEQSGTEDGRIVIVSSSLCKSGKIDLQKRDFVHDGRVLEADAKKSFAPLGYCDSKLMNMLTCRELAAAKLQGSNVSTYAVSPGLCKSKLGRNVQVPTYKKMLMVPLMRLFQRR